MLLLFLQVLHHFGIHTPKVFAYGSTRMLLASITTLFLTIFLGPRVIKKLFELKTGQSVRVEDCPVLLRLHEKKRETPTMGGILILFSLTISLLLWMDLTSIFTLMLLFVSLSLGLLGAYDDYLKMKRKNSKGIRSKKKLAIQVLIAGLIGLYFLFPGAAKTFESNGKLNPPQVKEQIQKGTRQGVNSLSKTLTMKEYIGRYYVPFKKTPFFVLTGAGLLLGWLFTIFIITGTSNAVNLSDGLDGLAPGLVLLIAGVLSVFAFFSSNIEMARYLNILYIEGSGEVAIYLSALVGACLGFLWYNGYPAQVFMGDTGSLALGGILGLSAILLRREFLLALIGGVLVAETLSVILQVLSYRYRNKRRIFLCAPLHHHFEFKGWPETKVVLRFWIVGIILAIIGIISLKFQ